MIGKISGSDIIRLGGKIQSSGKSLSQPHGFPKIPDEIKNNPGELLKFYIGIAQDTKYSKDIRDYAALKARRKWGFEKKESIDQEETRANKRLEKIEQFRTIADELSFGGFSHIVKAEEVFFNKGSVTPKEAITAYLEFRKGADKIALSVLVPGAIFKVAGKGGTFLFKVVGKKAGKLVLEFIKKVLNKTASKTPKKTPPTQATDIYKGADREVQKYYKREAAQSVEDDRIRKMIDKAKEQQAEWQKVKAREAAKPQKRVNGTGEIPPTEPPTTHSKPSSTRNEFNLKEKGDIPPTTKKVYEHGTGESLELSSEARNLLGYE